MPPDTTASLAWMDDFIVSTRQAVHVREVDRVLMIRPDKTMGLNGSAAAILSALYARGAPPATEALHRLAPALRVEPERLRKDAAKLLRALGAVLNEDFSPREGLAFGTFDRAMIQYPTLSEIALTYGCQNRCTFCYASSPHRGERKRPMSTDQVTTVMERIFHQGHVPSLSFTGGEATLRGDLPELIRRAKAIGFRVNLITNGIRLGDPEYARTLAAAGLDSVQVSLEAHDAALHDAIVGRRGAFEATTGGVRNMARLGLHVHTNTTLCRANLVTADELIHFVSRDLGLPTLSMNMVIRTGEALKSSEPEVSYTEVAARLPALLETARREGIRLVWYSPIPYCLFNPVQHGLGAKSCACVDGILSVDPTGQVLPCSSFEEGIGSLLERDFESIYTSRAARYWRQKEFLPPICRDCPDADICAGACPLYWDAAGTFAELPRPGSANPRMRSRWEHRRRKGRSFGVVPGRGTGTEG